jgi:Major Facilitator Superfamily
MVDYDKRTTSMDVLSAKGKIATLLFPIQFTVFMVILNCVGTIMSAVTAPLYDYYYSMTTNNNQENSWTFKINLLNVIPNFIYIPIALFCPIGKMKRYTFLLLCFIFTSLGTLLQSSYTGQEGYYVLLIATILQGIPQPLIMSTILVVSNTYFPPDKQSQMIGWFTSINNLCSGLIYLWCIENMYDDNGFQLNFYNVNIYFFIGTLLIAVIVSIPYFCLTSSREWNSSLVTPLDSGVLSVHEHPSHLMNTTKTKDIQEKRPSHRHFYVYFFIFGLLTSTGGILENILEQLMSIYQLSKEDALITINLFMLPTVPCTVFVGILYDFLRIRSIPSYILPLCIVLIQSIAQVGIFYFSTSVPVFMMWVTLFSICYGSLTVVFLPTLIRLALQNKQLITEESINQKLLLWATVCICISVFILCWPNTNILSFGYYMIGTSIVSVLLMGSNIF